MSAILTPAFPLTTAPETWDALTLDAATIFLEAEGEPEDGQIAVGYVIHTRVVRWKQTVPAVILAKWQFSCWNEDYRRRAEARLAAIAHDTEPFWRAAASTFWALVPDPSKGATHYLNPDATRAARPNHDLPDWYDETKVTATIGRHVFLNLG